MKQHDHRRRSDNNRFDHERLRFAIRASGLYTGSFARRIGLPDSEALYDVLTGLAPLSPSWPAASTSAIRRSTWSG